MKTIKYSALLLLLTFFILINSAEDEQIGGRKYSVKKALIPVN